MRGKLANKLTNNKNMKRELVFPLVIGIVAGVLAMIFVNFGMRLNNALNAMAQLQQATAQNSAAINDVIAFINQATGGANAQNGAAPTTPAN